MQPCHKKVAAESPSIFFLVPTKEYGLSLKGLSVFDYLDKVFLRQLQCNILKV